MAATEGGTCSPVDSFGPFYPLHQRSETAKSLPPMKFIEIPEFYKLIGEPPPAPAAGGSEQSQNVPKNKGKSRRGRAQKVLKEQTDPPVQESVAKTNPAFGTLPAFMDVLEHCLQGLTNNVLETEKRGSVAPAGHPNGSLARPDIVIFRKEYSLPQITDKVFWGSIKMPIEFHSAGKSYAVRLDQAATYALYLLEALPDLVSALGLLVESKSLLFLFCNAAGIQVLDLSNEGEYLQVLSAVVEYLNGGQQKNLDSTLSRVPTTVHFNVAVPNGNTSLGASGCQRILYEKCSLRYSHDPFGRRPNVFIYQPSNNVAAIRVIKDQYIRRNRCWTEKDILGKIHANGTYPAVVRMGFYGEIPQAACGNRIRVRIALQDHGSDFLSLKTPRDVIYALYDLLEVTRGLYSDRKILHRDISPGNIMIRDPGDIQVIDTCPSTSPVFIRHLLDPQVPKHKSSIFLIDFGYSQDLESSKPSRDGRTGTPVFIARAVQAGRPLPPSRSMFFPDLPRLSKDIKAVYECEYAERLESFNGAFEPQVGPSKNPPPPSTFHHKLEHDGESGVWSSFWWLLLACPRNEAQELIDKATWNALIPDYDGSRTRLPTQDHRQWILSGLSAGDEGIFHSGYKGLHKLFEDISMAILPDYHWAEDPIRQRPDFVHEILQRTILNFVVENKDAPFMDKEKAGQNRKPSCASNTAFLSAPETNSCHAA